MDDQLLSVKEYARHAGITEQAVYKKLKNEKSDLHQYLVEQNHKKFIKSEALKLIEDKQNPEKLESETLREMVDLLKSQIAEKDDQIQHLQKINDQLSAANSQLSSALESASASLQAAQALHARTLQQLQENEDFQDTNADKVTTDAPPTQDVEPTSDESLNDQTDTPLAEQVDERPEEPEKPQKKSFWARLFNL